MIFDSPASDQIEVSLFGPGYGECVVLHAGAGDWIIVDSCIDSRSGDVAPLRYLQDLGVVVERQVKHIVASHWHDDHTRGLSRLVEACSSARFWCPVAMTDQEFIQYAELHAETFSKQATGGTTEISRVLKVLQAQKRRRSGIAPNVLIHQNQMCSIYSLSPSSDRHDDFLQNLAAQMPRVKSVQRRARALEPNHLSAAIWIDLPHDGVLLGSDVEEKNGQGWSLIFEEQTCIRTQASVFKVPHHGSHNAHYDKVWAEVCNPGVNAVLSPFVRGSTRLPTLEDCERICGLANQAYATASPVGGSAQRYEPALRKEFGELGIKLRAAQPKTGHVRLRGSVFNGLDWSIELSGPAMPLKNIYRQMHDND